MMLSQSLLCNFVIVFFVIGRRVEVMQHKQKLRKYEITKLRNCRHSQRGYMMITLMLFVALITIALLAILPDMKQQIRRDREEELIHRGNAYMRAIQHFYKKFSRYPNSVDDLLDTNNMRFLRKRYTDPMNIDPKTGKERDFKFLHQQDITLNNGPALGPTAGQLGSGGQSPFGSGSQSGFGGTQGGLGGAQGGLGGLGSQSGGFQQAGGANAQSATTGDSSNSSSGNSFSGNSSGASGSNSFGSSPSSSSGSPFSSTSGSSSGLNGQTFGGGPILGVASLSKEKTIRVFFTKSHYNDWWFIYVPTTAQVGGLLTGPVNPNMPTGGSLGGFNPGQTPAGLAGQAQGLGQALGQGLGQGFGTTPNSGLNPTQNSPNSQTPQQTSPQQQQ